MNPTKVWYITGASQGFGLSLVKKLLAAGHRVDAYNRATHKVDSMKEEMIQWRQLTESADFPK